MNLLASITFQLPETDTAFGDKLLTLLASLGKREESRLLFTRSDAAFLPKISFSLANVIAPRVVFDLSGDILTVEVTNQTARERKNPATYSHISIYELAKRIKGLGFTTLDHVGFNLPWFNGIHPDILKLRKRLAGACAYYRFPTGENWDFILPASEEEIRSDNINLASKERRPKLEVVSFEKSSTPLIQIDCSVREKFEILKTLFPESIIDEKLRNAWVYVTNPYGIDLCFVVGEALGGDWSSFFDGHRLSA